MQIKELLLNIENMDEALRERVKLKNLSELIFKFQDVATGATETIKGTKSTYFTILLNVILL